MTVELPTYLKSEFPDLADNWNTLQTKFQLKTLPAHTTILNEGEISTSLFLIVQGSLRMWHNNENQEITLQFFFENQPVASFESFYLSQPSDSSIETLEETKLLVLSKNNFDQIQKNYPAFVDSLNRWLCERFIEYRKRVYSQLQTTPTGRYQALLADNPEVIERVPMHEIATYLGITPVSLSRIRTRLAKLNK